MQIYNSAENHLETTILAIPNYRVRPADRTVFTSWETPPGQPKALKAWFYPGDNVATVRRMVRSQFYSESSNRKHGKRLLTK